VDACITRCLQFGDLEELKKNLGPRPCLTRRLPILPDPALTEPSLLIRTGSLYE
jgi:anaerobic dimethyl sulfoxide reductase subunit B (iron-sulfur subunit)